MGGQEVLCLLSGIGRGGGPRNLVLQSDLHDVVNEMVDEIRATSITSLPNLASILHDALVLAADGDDTTWMPHGLGKWPYFDACIAIGFFDQDGYYIDYGDGPNTREVEMRRVFTYNEGGFFDYVLTDTQDSQILEEVPSNCWPWDDNPNFFVLEGCYIYLNAWLDRDNLSHRSVAFPNDAEPMSLASEFYEIVNTRAQPRSKF
jgi:hypothetical protein